MMIKQFILFSTVYLAVNGCIPFRITPAYVRQNVGNYDGVQTNIRDIMNIDGYFIHAEPEERGDSTYTYFMFFEDGMVNMQVHDYNVFPYSGKDEDISQYISQVVSNGNGKQAKMFYNSLGWGKYTIANDTVKVNYHSGWGYPDCYAFEMWFKVIDRNHVRDIYFSRITADTPQMSEGQNREELYENAIPSRFVPLENIPSTDCWLKRKKWFWYDEEQYRIYQYQNTKKE